MILNLSVHLYRNIVQAAEVLLAIRLKTGVRCHLARQAEKQALYIFHHLEVGVLDSSLCSNLYVI